MLCCNDVKKMIKIENNIWKKPKNIYIYIYLGEVMTLKKDHENNV